MPRARQQSDLLAETNVARRIGVERAARGLSYQQLAIKMRHVGVPLHQSSIYKIVHQDPPRRITVDELVGFARVFGVTVEELLVDPELAAEKELVSLILRYRDLMGEELRQLQEMRARQSEVRDRIRDLASATEGGEAVVRRFVPPLLGLGDDHAEAAEYVANLLLSSTGDDEEEAGAL